MNLDFGGILKDSDVRIGAAAATTENLPEIFATAPNFCAAVIFFVALWNSWCVAPGRLIPISIHRAQLHRSTSLCCPQVHVRQLHGALPSV